MDHQVNPADQLSGPPSRSAKRVPVYCFVVTETPSGTFTSGMKYKKLNCSHANHDVINNSSANILTILQFRDITNEFWIINISINLCDIVLILYKMITKLLLLETCCWHVDVKNSHPSMSTKNWKHIFLHRCCWHLDNSVVYITLSTPPIFVDDPCIDRWTPSQNFTFRRTSTCGLFWCNWNACRYPHIWDVI